jgi:hypothetical protein
MRGKTAVVLLAGLLFACTQPPEAAAPPAPAPVAAPPPAAAPAPTDHIVNIRGASCAALLALSPDDRADATMFYLGYQASRYGARTINVNAIGSMESVALSYCAAFPDRPAAAAFADAFSLGTYRAPR